MIDFLRTFVIIKNKYSFPGRAEMSKYDPEEVVRVAWYYYVESYTQKQISDLLAINRTKVIRLLEYAKETGVVSFKLNQSDNKRLKLEKELMDKFKLNDVCLVPRSETLVNLNESLAVATAMYIINRMPDVHYINVGYGDTLNRVINHLAASIDRPINFVSLTGGVNYYLPSFSKRFNANLNLIPSPLLLSKEETRNALIQDSSVVEIQKMVDLSDTTVVGIGGLNDDATIVKNGILSKNDLRLLQMMGSVGDVLSHFLDEKGDLISSDLEKRLISTSLDRLRKLDNVIGVSGGSNKVSAILSVLKGKYINVLITDETTGEQLIAKE